ncbi:hypothetical protein DICVIV_06078 [Dictyocaulus viviparus]|uniref:Carboxylesterase type B domain-containing protein n=1 Tax=Dictyocaulus viviparus TaxID=29172 RepID=A0A0D8XVJ4_DICVI|nr:hypothetical protein DICVIV_06078 [Dictyocaulus viviparus]
MSYLKAIVLLSALIVFDVRSIIVKISTGKLHGYQTMSDSGKLVNIFKQIPYAAPPVGHLRFQKPRPPDKWEGIREASGIDSYPINN